MNHNEQVKVLKKILEKSQKIGIFGHRNVDGDAIWSCLALWEILEKQGKQISYWTTVEPNPSFDFLPWIEKFKTNFDFHPHYDVLIFLDTANPIQLLDTFWVWHEAYFEKMNTVVIDHHISNTKYADLNIVDDTSSSACEILTEILKEIDDNAITPEVATYLFLWLSTDTGHFIYERDSSRTFWIAQYLLEKWADKKFIVDNLYRSTTLQWTQFIWMLINRIKKENWVIWTYYHKQELDTYNIDKEQADSILSILNRIKHDGVLALVKIYDHESPMFLKASLRSKWNIDVSEIASKFWWGGHKAAAGLKHIISDDREIELKKFIDQLT